MIALGLLVVLAVFFDVLRRIKASRYDSIRMPRRKRPVFGVGGNIDKYGSGLPTGGARVVAYRDEDDLEQVDRSIRQTAAAARPKLVAMRRVEPQQVSPGLAEAVDLFPTEAAATEVEGAKPDGRPQTEEAEPEAKAEPKTGSKPQARPNKPAAAVSQAAGSSSAGRGGDPAGHVIVLHVMALKEQPFPGGRLKSALLEADLCYGSMKIFHRHENSDGTGAVLFSVANSVNPGTFDLNGMEDFSSPGVSLFYTMPEVEKPGQVFDIMLAVAEKIANELGGVISDESRNSLTRQMIEHYRQRIAEFSRRRLVRRL